MRARTAIEWTAHRVRRTAVGWGLTSVLACVAVSACTSASGTTTVLSPSASGTVTVLVSPSDGTPTPTPTPTPTTIVTVTPSPSPSVIVSVSPSPYYTTYPTAAPVTGGGGTAGFQDAGLVVLGGVAILAGAGSIVYRRRKTRNR
jgi:ABC-type Fe3+-hydroxamate transport system substrate-binding protein